MQIHDQKIVSYEVNCKIQFTKEKKNDFYRYLHRYMKIFIQKCWTHANFLYIRKLYIGIRIWSGIMSFQMELGY